MRRLTRVMRVPLVIAGLVAVVGMACSSDDNNSDDDGPRTSPEATSSQTATAATTAPGSADSPLSLAIRGMEIPRDMVDGKKLGSDDAPIKLLMFEDFQCPFCLRFTAEDEPVLREEYVLTGKVQIQFVNFPVLGVESIQAAIASECAADQDMFWEYHEELFGLQADEGQDVREVVNQGRFDLEGLQELADLAGLDRAAFDACIASGEKVAVVDDQRTAGRAAGIRGTPGFLVNGAIFGDRGSDPGGPVQWRAALDQLLEE